MKVLKKRDGMYLIILCCVTYATAYLTRLSYSANITAIAETYTSFTSEDLGLISSFLFFAYAAGQLMSAALGKYYNPKWIVPLGMLLTAACNLGMALTDNLTALKLIWMVNGISQSLFWCNICNVQAKYISREQMPLCIMLSGFSYCFGTCGIYSLSAIFVNFSWRITFYTVFALAVAVGIWWFFAINRLERAEKVIEDYPKAQDAADTDGGEKKSIFRGRVLVLVTLVSGIAVMNSFTRDGITTWFPTILKEKFEFGDSVAMLITLGISMLSVLGISLNAFLTKHVRGKMLLQIFLFSLMAVSTSFAIFAFRKEISTLFIFLFAVNVCLIYCNGHIITSTIPFGIRKYGNVGSFSALLDCFCYLGSALATRLFASVATSFGWGYVLVMICAVSLAAAFISFIGSLISSKSEITKEIF